MSGEQGLVLANLGMQQLPAPGHRAVVLRCGQRLIHWPARRLAQRAIRTISVSGSSFSRNAGGEPAELGHSLDSITDHRLSDLFHLIGPAD